MKNKLHATTQFKKDLKRYVNQKDKMQRLYSILRILEEGERITNEYFPHKLHHEYDGCMECHIQDDFL